MPAMKEAIIPVIATPSTPFGRYILNRYGMASLYCSTGWSPANRLPTVAAAIRPGMMMIIQMSIFGMAPRIGVIRAAVMLFAAKARCTSVKFVVQ